MPFSLIPDLVLSDYSRVTPQLLMSRGVKLLLCDLDYTLAPKSVPLPDQALRQWLDLLQTNGITVMILSNNRSGKRVNAFCQNLNIGFVGRAGKPRKRGFLAAMKRAGTSPSQTAMLGDKLLTDVLGAKRSGLLAIIVEPLGGPVGPWNHFLHLLQLPFKRKGQGRSFSL